MNQHDFIALIEASQTTLKQELLNKHPESKYQLLMLTRSFDLLKQYISHAQNYDETYQTALDDYLGSSQAIATGLDEMCSKLRTEIDENALKTLRTLNQADLKITHPKLLG